MILFYLFMISLIIIFSLNSQTPKLFLHEPKFGEPWHSLMFNAFLVINNECNIFTFSLYFCIYMVHDYPI